MGGKAPKTPPAPDPYAVAGAQTGSNIGTAIANSWLGNANENGPLGSVKYDVTGSRKVSDGNGHDYDVPTFSRTTSLSPAQQKLLDQQNTLGRDMNNLAISQVKRLGDTLGQPLSLDGLPEAPGQRNYEAKDYTDLRKQTEDALFSRMNPQLERDHNALESKLINQGLVRGSEAFNTAMDENLRQRNDARTSVFLASGNEVSRAGNEDRANFSTSLQGDTFNATTRERALQERLLERNTPINEIAALMQGGQVSMPQFSAYNGGAVAATPVGQYVYDTANLQRQDAKLESDANTAMWNNVGKIAGAGVYKWSDARVKHDIRFVYQDPRGFGWYTFVYNGWDIPQFGVMAQELIDVIPEAVHTDPETGFYFVNYGAF